MPKGDKTGPRGDGTLTGRKMGYCAGNNRPGFAEGRNFGKGRARAHAGGYGFRQRNRFRQFDETGYGHNENFRSERYNNLESKISLLEEKIDKLFKFLKPKNTE